MAKKRPVDEASGTKSSKNLHDDQLRALLARTAEDLSITPVTARTGSAPQFFDCPPDAFLVKGASDPSDLFDDLVSANRGAADYFSCLAYLHRARCAFQSVLRDQRPPSSSLVAERALLEWGETDTASLATYLQWRKLFYDLDNRAAQVVAIALERVIARALGGRSFSASEVENPVPGRQIDCWIASVSSAYEIKLRVTEAMSGKGRLTAELRFPQEVADAGHTPVLAVLDDTPAKHLDKMIAAYTQAGGSVHLGKDAWRHFENTAPAATWMFLTKYVYTPMRTIAATTPPGQPLRSLTLSANQHGRSTVTPDGTAPFLLGWS